jgi:hypothetical protein
MTGLTNVTGRVMAPVRTADLLSKSFLTGCVILPVGDNEADEAGHLLSHFSDTDVVDALVVTIALRNHSLILTRAGARHRTVLSCRQQ